MKHAILAVVVALLACGGVTIGATDSSPGVPRETLDEYTVKCKTGCKRLEELTDYDGDKPCVQARDHNGQDCVEYCVHKMQSDFSTNPECWRELDSCDDFEEKCHLGDTY
jgi:hypothetical protein